MTRSQWLKIGGLLSGVAALITAIATLVSTVAPLVQDNDLPEGSTGREQLESPVPRSSAGLTPTVRETPRSIPNSATESVELGEHVLAMWPKDKCLYFAQAVEMIAGDYRVVFDFGDDALVSPSDIFPAPSPSSAAHVGMKVFAVSDETRAKWAPGEIREIKNGNEAYVVFDSTSECRTSRPHVWATMDKLIPR